MQFEVSKAMSAVPRTYSLFGMNSPIRHFDGVTTSAQAVKKMRDSVPVDVEGKECIDFVMSMALPILEHCPQAKIKAIGAPRHVKTRYLASRDLNHPKPYESNLTSNGFYVSWDIGELNNKWHNIHEETSRTANIGGHNVQIFEVEDFRNRVHCVVEADVFVDQDSADKNILHAAIVENQGLTRQKIVTARRKIMAAFGAPSPITFVTELPRTGRGKITLNALQ